MLFKIDPERLADCRVIIDNGDNLVVLQQLPQGNGDMLMQPGNRLDHKGSLKN
jgi:hypothetical protein